MTTFLCVALGILAADAPAELNFDITNIQLVGGRDGQRLLLTARMDDGSLRDVTADATITAEDANVAIIEDGSTIRPVGNGTTTIHAAALGASATTTVTVNRVEEIRPIHFTHDVVAAFTRAGCNSGACHGTPSGKNGFRLSLQGYLPDQDWSILTRELFGRRINRSDPQRSLVLLKGSARVPHEGGRRFGPDQKSYQAVAGWITASAPAPPADSPALERLVVTPGKRTLRNDSNQQQVVVQAVFADGTVRDVTALVSFTSSDPSVAEVSPSGLVTFHEKGSVAVLCRYLHIVDNAKLTYLKTLPDFVWSDPPVNNVVDQHVFDRLKELQIQPSDLCSDTEFVRRVHLDAVGVLPESDVVQQFLADANPEKRSQLIDRVLQRPEYADFWALKWGDILRSSRKQVSYRGAHNFRRYLVHVFAANRPFDEFATELITATGDTMMNPAANYYRVSSDPLECAESTAQLFLGVRMQCAKCHNHPFERWTQDDYYGLAACFARVGHKKPAADSDKEVVYLSRSGEVKHLRTGQVMAPSAPGADEFDVTLEDDRRIPLARWLVSAENPFFARSVVNRIWFHLMGKGIVEPVDDFRDSNPPRIETLLDALANEFVTSGYDFKHIVQLVLKSRTYQLSAKTNDTNATDEKYFSHCYPKLLPAEVLLDAISSATGVPEKFAGLPIGTRATQLPDPEFDHTFLKAFGQPSRELVCECGRESETTLTQALNLINGDVIHAKLRPAESRVHRLIDAGQSDHDIIESLYLATLSRPSTEAERSAADGHIAKIGDRTRALEDLHWALLNSKEFLFRH